MAAAPISGLTGSVTYTNGYAVLADRWTMALNAVMQDLTPLSPTSSHQQLATTGILVGGEGAYHCKLAVPSTALFTGPYDEFPESWTLRSTMTPREVTILGGTSKTYVGGLITTEIEMRSWIDDTTVLPICGTSSDAVLTAVTGSTYTVTYVVSEIDVEIDTDNPDGHMLTVRAAASAFPSAVTLPLPGTTGTATFVAVTGKQYSGTIFATSVVTQVNRRTGVGGIDVGFVWSGTITPA